MLDERLHAKAEEILAKAGKKPGEYDEAEYRAALGQAQEAGVTSTSDVVHAGRVEAEEDAQSETDALHSRAIAILREGGLMFSYDEDQYAAALEAAEAEHVATAEMVAAHGHVVHGIDLNTRAAV
jgi:hypothetical protein